MNSAPVPIEDDPGMQPIITQVVHSQEVNTMFIADDPSVDPTVVVPIQHQYESTVAMIGDD
jgi:hypothetical protein